MSAGNESAHSKGKNYRVGVSVEHGNGSAEVVEETISATSREFAVEHLWQLLEQLGVETWVVEEDEE